MCRSKPSQAEGAPANEYVELVKPKHSTAFSLLSSFNAKISEFSTYKAASVLVHQRIAVQHGLSESFTNARRRKEVWKSLNAREDFTRHS